MAQAAADACGVAGDGAADQPLPVPPPLVPQAAAGEVWIAELPLTCVGDCQCRRCNTPPPSAAGGVAADGAVGQRDRAGGKLYRPPPLRCGVAADGAVGQRDRAPVVEHAAAGRSRAAGDRQSRDRRRDTARPRTPGCPPPLTVTPAAGPVIVSVPPVLLSSSWLPVRVIVWARGEDGAGRR